MLEWVVYHFNSTTPQKIIFTYHGIPKRNFDLGDPYQCYCQKTTRLVAEKLNLNELSMGMSADFEQAISNGSTYLRLGTIILGERPTTI